MSGGVFAEGKVPRMRGTGHRRVAIMDFTVMHVGTAPAFNLSARHANRSGIGPRHEWRFGGCAWVVQEVEGEGFVFFPTAASPHDLCETVLACGGHTRRIHGRGGENIRARKRVGPQRSPRPFTKDGAVRVDRENQAGMVGVLPHSLPKPRREVVAVTRNGEIREKETAAAGNSAAFGAVPAICVEQNGANTGGIEKDPCASAVRIERGEEGRAVGGKACFRRVRAGP